MLLIKKEYFSSLTYTIINTLVGLLTIRIIYENYSDVIDEYIIMSTLRQEGLFSFIGAGLINGALVYGAGETIKEVNYFLFSRLKIIFVSLIPIVVILHFANVNYIYIDNSFNTNGINKTIFKKYFIHKKQFFKIKFNYFYLRSYLCFINKFI